ncbi:hypothetical protein D3C73_1281680 [compost metagenome]
MSACVSPPQLSVSHMVQVAASMAQAASTALPPCWKIIDPAVAAIGFPVMAIQLLPYNMGFWVCWAMVRAVTMPHKRNRTSFFMKLR